MELMTEDKIQEFLRELMPYVPDAKIEKIVARWMRDKEEHIAIALRLANHPPMV